ncbi:MAG: DUF262 domain-containing protein [Pyrinomonadaceae bacterium]
MKFGPAPQLISWFRDRYLDRSLTIKPPYQRRPVWAMKQKCYLIESILLGFPIPEIYVQSTTTAEGATTFAIVDGQQRIRAILQFIGVESDPQEEEFNKFVLDKLPNTSPWKDKSFADLTTTEKSDFYGYQLAVRLLQTHSEVELRDMFERLNKYLTPAKPQELRNARFSGPLVRLVEALANDEYWAENRIVSPQLIRRMGDFEFISELLIGVLHGPQAGSAAVIDEYYSTYEDYDDEFPEQRRAKKSFEKTLEVIRNLFPNIKETRWGNKTDFYTLFVGLATLLKSHDLPPRNYARVASVLNTFAEEVNLRLSNERAKVSEDAVSYVRAVEKGANDKARRAERHRALVDVIEEFFSARIKTGGKRVLDFRKAQK